MPMGMSWNASVSPSWITWSTTLPWPSRSPQRAPGRRNGAPLMLSVPPATTTSASPHRSACAASITAFSPEPQTLFTVWAGTDSGSPALMADCRAGFMPRPAWRMQPRITSSTWSGRTPERRTASFTATVPSSTAETSLNAPPKLPMGVRHPPRITTSVVLISAFRLHSARGRPPAATRRGGTEAGAPSAGGGHHSVVVDVPDVALVEPAECRRVGFVRGEQAAHGQAHLHRLVHVALQEETAAADAHHIVQLAQVAEDDVDVLVEVLVVDLVDAGNPFHDESRDAVYGDEMDPPAVALRQLEHLLVRHPPQLVAEAARELEAQHGLARLHGVGAEVLLLGHAVEGEILLQQVEPVVVAHALHVELQVSDDEGGVGELGRRMAHRKRHRVAHQLHDLRQPDAADQGVAGHSARGTRVLDRHAPHPLALDGDGLDVGAEEDLASHRLDLGRQPLVDSPRAVAVIDPRLVVGLGDLAADAQQALDEIDEVEALDLLRSELLGDLGRAHLPDLLRVVAEGHAVEGAPEALAAPVLEVVDGDRDQGMEDRRDRELDDDAEAEKGVELEQRLAHLQGVPEALALQVDVDLLAPLDQDLGLAGEEAPDEQLRLVSPGVEGVGPVVQGVALPAEARPRSSHHRGLVDDHHRPFRIAQDAVGAGEAGGPGAENDHGIAHRAARRWPGDGRAAGAARTSGPRRE